MITPAILSRQRGFFVLPGGMGAQRPAGGASGSTTTWGIDAADQSGGFVLSNGNRTATENSGANQSIRASVGQASGKWYWETTVSADASFNCAVGIRRSDSVMSLAFNSGKDLMLRSTGALFTGTTTGTTTGTGAAYVSGDITMCAFDFTGTEVRLWVGINGTWTNSGNPGAGTGALFVSTDLGGGLSWFPYFGCDNNAGVHVGTINVGPGFAYTVPSGFSAI